MAKVALLIGVSEYEPGLKALPAAVRDIKALQQVLTNPDMGEFAEASVTVLPNPSRQEMEDAIYTLFADRQKDDLVLLYFSGHGVLDDSNEFYFASRSTRKEQGRLIPTTAVAAQPVRGWLERSRAQRKVIILDSCFSGAFAKGVKAKDGGTINPEQFLGGKGTAILTASTSTQYALTQDDFDLSIYTHYLVEGIRTGGADQDNDGWIAMEELHTYASSKVKEAAPAMTPEFYPVKEGYKILLAKSPKDDPKLRYRKQVEQRAHQGTFTIPARRLLNSLRSQLQLTLEEAEAIEAEVLQPYREYQRKLQEYEQTLVEALQVENPLSQRTLNDLKDYQQHLALLDEDVAPITTKLLDDVIVPLPLIVSPSPALPSFHFNIITVNDRGEEIDRQPRQVQYFTEELGNGVTLDLVKIPAGEFYMGTAETDRDAVIQEYLRYGSKQENAERWVATEMPQHRVKVPEFWLGKFPVTQAQWSQVAEFPKVNLDLNPDPSNFKGAKRPVEQVSWDEAVEFCDRLSQKTGRTYRLPSEAEWEYACRAGTTTPFHFGATITPALVNYAGNYPYGKAPKGKYRQQTTEAGSFPPNAFGLYDMHGNVWEWCADPWHDSYDRAPGDGSVWELESDRENTLRLLRGGSWDNDARSCRSANRYGGRRDNRNLFIGFRILSPVPSTL